MNQSTVILGYLAAAFLIFITVRGELPQYLGFLLGSGQGTAAPQATPSTQAQGATSTGVGNASNIASEALSFTEIAATFV